MIPNPADTTDEPAESSWRKSLRKALIRFHVWKDGPVARGRLADDLNLNLPTVSNCVAELLAAGDLVEEGFADSTGGRKPQLLKVNPAKGSVVGLTFSSRGISSAWADLKGSLQNVQIYPFNISSGKGRALSIIREAIGDQLDAIRAADAGPVCQIGVGISGLLNSAEGVSNGFPRFEEWTDVPLRSLIEDWHEVPTVLDSHIAAIALAETIFGQYRDFRNALYVQLGPGLGLGVVIGGEIYRGSRRNVGEFGHTTLTGDDGPICYCGSYGCLESIASDYAMVQQAEAALREGVGTRIPEFAREPGRITPGAIFRAAQAGDRFATNLVEKVARLLGTGIANLVNLFGPDIVILGGTMSEAGDLLLDPLCATLGSKALDRMDKGVAIKTSSFGKDEAIKGATTLALHTYMTKDIHSPSGHGRTAA